MRVEHIRFWMIPVPFVLAFTWLENMRAELAQQKIDGKEYIPFFPCQGISCVGSVEELRTRIACCIHSGVGQSVSLMPYKRNKGFLVKDDIL